MEISNKELLKLTLKELNQRGHSPSLPILAAFIMGKKWDFYGSKEAPNYLADCWIYSGVEKFVEEVANGS